MDWRWWSVATWCGVTICGCGDDAEGTSGSASAEGGSSDVDADADGGSESLSSSGSASGSGSSADGEAEGGGDCCGIPECADGSGAGDPCNGAACCAGGVPMICADLQCGSQSCVGTLEPSSCSDCDLLMQHMGALFQQAVVCDPANDTCVVSRTLTDTCGCDVAVADDSPVLDELQAIYDDWVAQGCGPLGCGAPCPVGEAQCIDAAGMTYCGFAP